MPSMSYQPYPARHNKTQISVCASYLPRSNNRKGGTFLFLFMDKHINYDRMGAPFPLFRNMGRKHIRFDTVVIAVREPSTVMIVLQQNELSTFLSLSLMGYLGEVKRDRCFIAGVKYYGWSTSIGHTGMHVYNEQK